jgi:hypothetical protein
MAIKPPSPAKKLSAILGKSKKATKVPSVKGKLASKLKLRIQKPKSK